MSQIIYLGQPAPSSPQPGVMSPQLQGGSRLHSIYGHDFSYLAKRRCIRCRLFLVSVIVACSVAIVMLERAL